MITGEQRLRAPSKLWLIVLAIGMALAAPMAMGEYGDVVLNKRAEKEGVKPVVFPHWFHRLRFTCDVCHNENGFKMRAGSNDITMADIVDGKYCGMCHNNEIAWSPEFCYRCHSGLPGLASGFYGSQLPQGPRGVGDIEKRRH